MERSAKGSFFFLGHTSILWIWTSGLQANRFLTLLLTGHGPRRKVGRIHTEMDVGVGINKEILPQWISVKDWQTKNPPSVRASGSPYAVAHEIQLTPHLTDCVTSAQAIGCTCTWDVKQLSSETWTKAVNMSLCVWTATTLCTAFHLKYIKMSWLLLYFSWYKKSRDSFVAQNNAILF